MNISQQSAKAGANGHCLGTANSMGAANLKLVATPLCSMHQMVPQTCNMPNRVPAAIPQQHHACKQSNTAFLLRTLSHNALPSSGVGLALSALANDVSKLCWNEIHTVAVLAPLVFLVSPLDRKGPAKPDGVFPAGDDMFSS